MKQNLIQASLTICLIAAMLIGASQNNQIAEVRSQDGKRAVRIVATNGTAQLEFHNPSPHGDGVTIIEIFRGGDIHNSYIFPEGFTEEQKRKYIGPF